MRPLQCVNHVAVAGDSRVCGKLLPRLQQDFFRSLSFSTQEKVGFIPSRPTTWDFANLIYPRTCGELDAALADCVEGRRGEVSVGVLRMHQTHNLFQILRMSGCRPRPVRIARRKTASQERVLPLSVMLSGRRVVRPVPTFQSVRQPGGITIEPAATSRILIPHPPHKPQSGRLYNQSSAGHRLPPCSANRSRKSLQVLGYSSGCIGIRPPARLLNVKSASPAIPLPPECGQCPLSRAFAQSSVLRMGRASGAIAHM